MKDLNYQLMKLCRQNRDGGYSTQATRSRILDLVANQLHELGYARMQATSLKPKHIETLVALWSRQGIKIGTLKNRLAALRWWAGKINKANVVARDNTAYGIGARTFVAEHSKAQVLDTAKLERIEDKYVRLSVRLQAAFGLRREEAIKFNPGYAIRGDHIALKSTWTKGGRARSVPITNIEQRRLLQDVKAFCKGGSLIPAHLNYVQQQHRYDRQTRKVGMRNLHGLRHGYAQARYRQLTGFLGPAAGGPSSKQLTLAQRALDQKARATISRELGHGREAITAVYCGE
jgi:site-specific recombinase XerC